VTRPALRHLFLDLDGTLVDPFEGIMRSLAHALEAPSELLALVRALTP